MLTFGDLLRRHRLTAGLSQEALAERAGLSLRGLSDLERGARRAPYRDTVLRLADALDLGDPDRSELLAASRRRRPDMEAPLPEPSRTAVPVPLSSFVGRGPGEVHLRRRALGRGQAQLGAALRVGVGTLARWERGVIGIGQRDVQQLALHRPDDARVASPMSEPVPDATRLVGGASLPARPTPLIGRQTALRELRTLLSETRLLTLVGPGGVGKTRLALELASLEDAERAHGVVFVDLAPAREPALVLALIAQALDVRDLGGVGLELSIVRGIGSRQLLLVLDNFEQVVQAAPHVAALLQACPGLKVVVTSREPLRLSWERRYALRPLEVPAADAASPGELAAVPAVTLFVQRAQAVQPTFALDAHNAVAVSQLCARLDGLPLAIELAAAHVVALPPGLLLRRLGRRLDLLRGLRDQPARHASLRVALDWGYALLDSEEQVLFRRLSVFAGGWSLEAAEAVCAGGVLDASALVDVLARLVERSLVILEAKGADVRYRLLETLREYAAEQLVASEHDAEAVRRSHRDWCLALAEAAEREMLGPDQGVWLRQLDAEHDNLRAALRWTIDRADTEPGLRLGAALWRFWFNRGHFTEGRRWLEQLLALPGSDVPSRAATLVHFGVGTMALEQTDFGAADAFAERTLEISQACGYARGHAAAWLLRGNVERGRGEYTQAGRCYAEALSIQRTRTDAEDVGQDIAITLGTLGHVALAEGDCGQARAYYQAALAIEREHGQRKDMANLLYRLGEVALEEGALGEARAHFGESLGLAQEVGDRQRLAYLLEGFAALAAAEHLPRRATLLAGAAARLREAIGSPLPGPERDRLQRRLQAAAGAAGHAPELTLPEAVALAVGPAD